MSKQNGYQNTAHFKQEISNFSADSISAFPFYEIFCEHYHSQSIGGSQRPQLHLKLTSQTANARN